MPSGMGGRAPLFGDSEIISAAIKIQADGGDVTPYTLMGRLGGGSVPYFKKAIKRLTRDGAIQTEAIIGEYDDVLESVVSLLDKTRNEAALKAHMAYKSDRAQYEASNVGLREELALRAADIKRLNDDLAATKLELAATCGELNQLKVDAEELRTALAATTERANNLGSHCEKEEAKNNELLDRLHSAHIQFQSERRELLDRLNDATLSTRNDINLARQAEQNMRLQLSAALKDGIEHTKVISKLRDEISVLNGGKSLLKKYGSWQKISALCASALRTNSKK